MKNFIKAALLFPLMVSLCGCATMFSAKVTSITIESDPSSAEIKDKSGKTVGNTPYTFSPSKEEKYNYFISKKGFEESELNIRPRVDEAALFGDAMLLCIPCIVDIPSKAYLNFPRSKYKIDLQRSRNAEKESEQSLFSQ